jgi:molecular chaperone DnaJ
LADRDYYEVLGVAREADLAAITRAYRQAAVKNHPDRNPDDPHAEERFKEAAEAYAVLSDPQKRQRYDQFGKAGLGGGPGFRGFDQEIFGDFSDILGDLFGFGSIFGGGRRGGRRGARGGDLRYDLEIDLEEAVRGLETRIRVPRHETCERCRGNGAEEGGSETCTQCGGRGQVAFQQGFFTIARPCGQCNGQGRRITDPCRECGGKGRNQRERTLTVRIPAGVDEGMRLRMSGEGESGTAGAPPGDLYVVIHVREHDVFVRDQDDLHCRVHVSFPQVALGTEVEVPTIDGKETLKIPAGTQSGERFRLRGHGAPSLNGGRRGDQYVTVQVHTPKRVTAEQRELLEKLAELGGDEAGERGLFDRVKDIFN